MLPRVVSLSSKLRCSARHSHGLLRPALGVFALSVGLSFGCSSAGDSDGPVTSSGGAGTGGVSAGVAGAGVAGAGVAGTNGASTGGGGATASGGTSGGFGGATSNGGAKSGGASNGGADGGMAGSAERGGNGGVGGSGLGGAGGGGQTKSAGCGKTRTLLDGNRTLKSGGSDRGYVLRTPTDYDNTRPYRLMLGFHGAGGKGADVAPSFFGIWELSQGSTIFAAPNAVGGIWKADVDTTMVSDLVKQLKDDLCIDTSRVEIEGFSQGGAMVWTLACALPGTFRVAVVHSGGGLAMPKTCEPIPFFSTLGNDGSGQGMSSDFFAKTNGCTVEPMPMPPSGGHVCTDYKGCSAGHPTRWCDYDAGHTPAPTDPGQKTSWVPQEVWNFIKVY